MPAPPSDGPNRSQFLIGPKYAARDGWTRLELADSLLLSAHPGLPVQTVDRDGLRLTLLGFMLDWAHPERDDQDILGDLLASSFDFDRCWRATAELGGRWALIHQVGGEARLFHDASGMRQVCYAPGATVWCASQPGLLAEHAGLEPDPEALAFIEWHGERNAEYWWPGERQPFAGAYALLPNHALNMNDGRVTRYWPQRTAPRLDASEARERVATRLKGLMRAAVNRFDVALGLSAGWDSRILLAASRTVRDRLSIYNGCGADMAPSHRDVVIPRRLAERVGLSLDLIAESHEADPDFAARFERHSWRPHPHFATGMQADFDCYERRKVAVIGNVSEIGKLPYRAKVAGREAIDGERLAGFYWGGHPFAARALDEWLQDVGDGGGYNLLDLFYWEQRLGRWLAANCLEFDFAWCDILAPFNVRALMVDLLASDENVRRPPEHALYLSLIEALWPELLVEPINPVPKLSLNKRLRSFLRRGLARMRRGRRPRQG
jgi:hypothetical protein